MDFKELRNKVSGLTLLYVEDEEDIRKSSTMFFKKLFTDVDSAENGAEGLELFSKKPYDIVISDIKMPIMDGNTMIEEIKKIKPDVVTIIMSGFSSKDAHENINCDYFISKPPTLDVLTEILSNIVNKVKK